MNTKNQAGAALLIMTVILFFAALLLISYAVNYSVLQQKSSSNQYSNNQAYEAAEAGLEFGYQYLTANTSTILANPSGGFISYGPADSNITNVTLANNSKFSVVYSNPTANNYNILLIVSTGVSKDGTSTRTIQQEAYQQANSFNYSAFSLGNVTLVGGSTLTNTTGNTNISTGGTVTINNGASTYISSGQSSYQGHIASDIQQNVAAYQGLTESAFFQNVFNSPEATVKSSVQSTGSYYSNSGPDYSQTLKGKTGTTIWIDQTNGSTVTIGQGVTIGSAASPVTMIVEGDLSIANGATIYGFVYASGPVNGFSLAGGAKIIGGIASGNTLNISNGFQLTYQHYPVLVGGSGSFSKIPGTWKDF